MAEREDLKQKLKLIAEQPNQRAEARELAYRAIQKFPNDAEIRIMLAKLFYLDGLFEFAARELIEAQFIQPTPAAEKLLLQFSEFSSPLLARYKNPPLVAEEGKIKTVSAPTEALDPQVVAELDVELDIFEEEK